MFLVEIFFKNTVRTFELKNLQKIRMRTAGLGFTGSYKKSA